MLAQSPSQPTEEWRESKKRELEALHQSAVAYFARIDPKLDTGACRCSEMEPLPEASPLPGSAGQAGEEFLVAPIRRGKQKAA